MAATKPNPTTAPAPATPADATPKRTRMAFSKDKKFGYLLLSLLDILKIKAIADLLTEDQKTKVAKAATAAKELGAEDPFKAIDDRILAIQKELTELQKKPVNPTDNAAFAKYVEAVKELSADLNSQVKRKAQITEMLGK